MLSESEAIKVLERLAKEGFDSSAKGDNELAAILRSKSWRLTAPLRRAGRVARHSVLALHRAATLPLRAADNLRRHGVRDTWRKGRRWLQRPNRRHRVVGGISHSTVYQRPAASPAPTLLHQRVLLIAELSLPQCKKYRVQQKRELFELLDVPCTVLDWRQESEARAALQTHSLVIFYRAPGFPSVLGLIAEAKRLGVPTIWEVDDLIFDQEKYETNRNLDLLDPALRKSVLDGVPIYRAALQACDYGLASTEVIADAMREAGVRDAFVIHNAIDQETLQCAERLLASRRQAADGSVLVFYGSGSKSHDGDFLCASKALAEAMRQRENVRLRIVGDLTLPTEFEAFEARIERLPFADYPTYLRLLADADINLAPLGAGTFNDGKSNIKFLEAAALAIPSVCSPRREFRTAISDGESGLLADSEAEWLSGLLRLADDPDLRRRLGAEARRAALSAFERGVIAAHEARPLVERIGAPPPSRFRVLEVNIFYSPRSFGGATVVVEELSKRLHQRTDTDVFVFTSCDLPQVQQGDLIRYEADGIPVFAVPPPPAGPRSLDFDNPNVCKQFAQVLLAVRPDVVHFHCLQELSVSLADVCKESGTPYVVTLHDAWWLCERQFLVREDGHHCFQQRIDWKVCASCVPDLGFSLARSNRLRTVLEQAALLLAPSEYQRRLYAANDLDLERIVVNKNGIRKPAGRPCRKGDRIRFAFVGGLGPVKGSDLIRRAFEEIDESNYELILVDNTMNLGFSSIRANDWRLRGKVSIVPAYNQETIDDFFAGVDVLLFPTQTKESFGLAVREALARDAWVILTDAGGSVEEVVDGENGTIIPIHDQAALRDAIRLVLQDPGRLANYRNPYRDWIVTFDEQAAQLHALLTGAAAEPTTGEPIEIRAALRKTSVAA